MLFRSSLLGFGPEQKWRLFLGLRALAIRIRRLYRRDRRRHTRVTQVEGSRGPDIAELYRRALNGYLPKPYSGHVALFRPAEGWLPGQKDPTYGWSYVAPQIEIHRVPGGHLTCITTHVKVLADHMKACLEKAQGRG